MAAERNDVHKTPDEITDEISRHEGFLILEAGAGTGKTHNLTERVIHQLVDKKVPLERMLALTFTDFAAAEMRSRIYAEINRNIGKSEHLLAVRQRFSRNYISTFHSFCNRILQYFPDEVTEISVSDAPRVFGQPVEERAVDGALELLSDYDEVLWMMEWRKRFYRKYKEHPGLQRQLNRLSVSDFEQFMDKLEGVDERELEKLALMPPGQYPGWIREKSVHWREERDALLQDLLETFSAHPEWFKSPDKIPRSMDGLSAIKNKGKGFKKAVFDRTGVDDAELAEIDRQGDRLFDYENALTTLDEYLSRPELEREILAYPESEQFDPDHEAYWNMRDLSELGLRWAMLMRYQRFESGYFNYDDMIWLTHRLFTGHPAVAARMRGRFDQILVDEFQDTDRKQWEILARLAFPDPETAAPNGKKLARESKQLLIVGDVKQAIYGFRGGDVAMMRRVQDELARRSKAPGAAVLLQRPLPYSFRSNRAVIRFANALFRDVFGPREQAASYEAHHQPLEHPPAGMSRNSDAPGEVRVLLADGKALGEELKKRDDQGQPASVEAEVLASHPVHLEARRIARYLREVYGGHRQGYEAIHRKMQRGEKAVGVLYRRRTHMYALEDALREEGLPYTVAKGTRYYMRREVRDAWLLLSFLLDAFDDVSLVGLLRSPMISLSDSGLLTIRVVMDDLQRDYPNFWSAISDHASWSSRMSDADRLALESGVPLLRKLREQVPTRRVSELLEAAVFTDGPYLAASPGHPQIRENLVKLLDVIRNLESTGRGTLYEVTGFLSDRIREEASDSEAEQADPAPIQLMTIHGSKGLEFPMVVLPDMYAGNNESGVQLYLADDDPDSFLWPSLAYKPGNREGDHDAEGAFLFRFLKAERQKRQMAETRRLFYVAVTRAESHVLLSLAKPIKGTSGSFAELLEPWIAEQQADPVYKEPGQLDQAGKEPAKIGTNQQNQAGRAGKERIKGSRDRTGLQKVIEIEQLTPQELEQLADRHPAGKDEAAKHVKGIDPEKIRIPDRNAEPFGNADAQVSAEVRTASGKKVHRPGIEEQDAEYRDHVEYSDREGESAAEEYPDKKDHPAVPPDTPEEPVPGQAQPGMAWDGLSPADAGTLIHRTLEAGPDLQAPSTRDLERFWKRELIRMNVADPDTVVVANSSELLRHCRNASGWISEQFGENAQKRFEVAFEVQIPADTIAEDKMPERTGDGLPSAKRITIRGSIDMIIRDQEGREHIVDFKTGPVTELPVQEQPASPQEGKGALVRHARSLGYDLQIDSYRMAWEVVQGRAGAPALSGPALSGGSEAGQRMDPGRVWLLFTAPETARSVSLADF
ncbi:MAG: UvrD-helicase domain-containing protein [Cyclonatronaceae bacterium]